MKSEQDWYGPESYLPHNLRQVSRSHWALGSWSVKWGCWEYDLRGYLWRWENTHRCPAQGLPQRLDRASQTVATPSVWETDPKHTCKCDAQKPCLPYPTLLQRGFHQAKSMPLHICLHQISPLRYTPFVRPLQIQLLLSDSWSRVPPEPTPSTSLWACGHMAGSGQWYMNRKDMCYF